MGEIKMAITLSDSQMLTREDLSSLLNLKPRTIDTLRRQKKIPSLKYGYRLFRFERAAVERALGRLEQHEIGRP